MRRTLTSKQQNKEPCPSNLEFFFSPEVAQEDMKKTTLLEMIKIPVKKSHYEMLSPFKCLDLCANSTGDNFLPFLD